MEFDLNKRVQFDPDFVGFRKLQHRMADKNALMDRRKRIMTDQTTETLLPLLLGIDNDKSLRPTF
jgi:hypothetical protein